MIENLKKMMCDFLPKGTSQSPPPPELSGIGLHALSRLFPYESYDTETGIYINKRSAGIILEAAPATGSNEEMVTILTSLLTDTLPENADFQCLLWCSSQIGPWCDAFEAQRKGHGETLEWLAKKRTDFLKKGALESLSTQGSFLARDFRLFLVASIPCKRPDDATATIEALLQIREDIVSSLKSVSIHNHPLPVNDFLSLMRALIQPSSNLYPDCTPWQEQDTLANQITDSEYRVHIQPHHLSFEHEHESWEARCFSVRHFPKPMAQWKMTDSIGQLFNSALQIPCSFVISLHLRLQESNKSNVKAQMQFLDSDKTARSPLAKFNPLLGEQRQDWEYVRTRLAEGDRLVSTFYQIVLFSPEAQMPNAERKLRDLYRANGWKLGKESYLQLQSWLAIMPMLMSEGMYEDLKIYGRLRTITAFNAVNIMPLQGEWKGTRTPSLLLLGRRGQLTSYSPFDNTEGNYNIIVAASSGKGKSMFTQDYIMSLLGCGGRVWVIDIGRSYEKTCHAVGGKFIEFSPDTPICLNPFTHIRNFNESLDMLKPLVCTMARPNHPASDEESAWIEKALKAAWELKKNDASITTVAEWLKTQNLPICDNLALLLYSYTADGMYGRYFEGRASIGGDDRLVVLELEGLKSKKDLQRIVLLALMYQITEIMYRSSRNEYKSCIIEEVWDIFTGDNIEAARFVEAGYRTARRYNGNFVAISQSINDFFRNSFSLAAFENSDNAIILGQQPESIDQLKKTDRLTMDAFKERLLKSLRKTDDFSECIIKTPSGFSVHRIVFDPYVRILYSSKGKEFEAVKTLQSQGHSLLDAVSIVSGEHNHVYEL